MSPSCPGTYYGSVLFSGNSMAKWYQGPELPPSCRCWRFEIKNYYSFYPGGWMPQYNRAVSQGKQLEATVMSAAGGKEKTTSVVSEIFISS